MWEEKTSREKREFDSTVGEKGRIAASKKSLIRCSSSKESFVFSESKKKMNRAGVEQEEQI